MGSSVAVDSLPAGDLRNFQIPFDFLLKIRIILVLVNPVYCIVYPLSPRAPTSLDLVTDAPGTLVPDLYGNSLFALRLFNSLVNNFSHFYKFKGFRAKT